MNGYLSVLFGGRGVIEVDFYGVVKVVRLEERLEVEPGRP